MLKQVSEAQRVREFGDVFLAHRNGTIVVMEVYLDETGTDDNSSIIGVSAVWADNAEWFNWCVDWVRAKHPIKVHHSVDCHNRVGEWKDWTQTKRDEYVLRILPVIRGHNIQGIFAGIDRKALADVLRSKHADLTDAISIEGWYFICLAWALRSAWEKLLALGHDNIAFVHEDNQYRHAASEAYDIAKKALGRDDATFGRGSKAVYVPLQCADLLAYEGNHQLRNFGGSTRKPLAAIDPAGLKFGFFKYDKSEVWKLAEFAMLYMDRIRGEFLKG